MGLWVHGSIAQPRERLSCKGNWPAHHSRFFVGPGLPLVALDVPTMKLRRENSQAVKLPSKTQGNGTEN